MTPYHRHTHLHTHIPLSHTPHTPQGKQGDLTPEVIDEMCSKIDYAMYLDATGDYGPL